MIIRIVEMKKQKRKYFYEKVPGLGNVAVSRHAQSRMDELGISQEAFEDILLNTPRDKDIEESGGVIWRQANGIRLIIITPSDFRGAKLIKTVYKIKPQGMATRSRSW